MVLHDGSLLSDYHFIIKKLTKDFKGQSECLCENMKQQIRNLLSTNEKAKRKRQESDIKIKFIDSIRLMASLLSSFTGNLYKGLHKGKCESCRCSLEYTTVKDNTLRFQYLNCNKNYEKEFGKGLEKRFQNRYCLCNEDINKICLMLREGV